MNIVIATPLYPPDIGLPAPYVKELARRLSNDHRVTIVTYGRLLESIPGVTIVGSDKRSLLPIRLSYFGFLLWKATRAADVLLIENGPSVELPAFFVTFRKKLKTYLHIGDTLAKEVARKHIWHRRIHTLLQKRVIKTITDLPIQKPEILAFSPYPTKDLECFEREWNEHISFLTTLFTHETR